VTAGGHSSRELGTGRGRKELECPHGISRFTDVTARSTCFQRDHDIHGTPSWQRVEFRDSEAQFRPVVLRSMEATGYRHCRGCGGMSEIHITVPGLQTQEWGPQVRYRLLHLHLHGLKNTRPQRARLWLQVHCTLTQASSKPPALSNLWSPWGQARPVLPCPELQKLRWGLDDRELCQPPSAEALN
jgi:hypothetical protein